MLTVSHEGAGKTTLMSVLADRLQDGKMKGEILVNGVEKRRISSTKWSRIAAYVMQAHSLSHRGRRIRY